MLAAWAAARRGMCYRRRVHRTPAAGRVLADLHENELFIVSFLPVRCITTNRKALAESGKAARLVVAPLQAYAQLCNINKRSSIAANGMAALAAASAAGTATWWARWAAAHSAASVGGWRRRAAAGARAAVLASTLNYRRRLYMIIRKLNATTQSDAISALGTCSTHPIANRSPSHAIVKPNVHEHELSRNFH